MSTPHSSLPARLAGLLAATLLLVTLPEVADARRGGGGGFTRGGPASSGSLSSRPAADGGMGVDEARAARGTQGARSAQDMRSAGGVRSTGGARSAQGAGDSTVRAEVLRAAHDRPVVTPHEAPVSTAQMDAYRAQFRAQNRIVEDGEDDRWDDRWQDGKRHPVAAAAIIGAAANEQLDNTVEVLDVLDDETAYQSELPCSLQGMLEIDETTYYRCEQGWYKRGLEGDNIVYIKTDPPPGY